MDNYAIKRIIRYFKNNPEIFNECIEQLDKYTDCLMGLRYHNMTEFEELCYGLTAFQIVCKAYYGYDEDSYIMDGSIKRSLPFNPNKKYFIYDGGYGNFVSSNTKDYSDFLRDNIIKQMNDYRKYIDKIYDVGELWRLFSELD